MLRYIRTNKGFTMFELLIVIAIMGVISSIAIPNVFGIFNGMKKRADTITATTISHAVMEAFIDGVVKSGDGIDIPAADDAPITPYLAENKGLKPQSSTNSKYYVTVLDEGKCTIEIKTSAGIHVATLYPDADEGYK